MVVKRPARRFLFRVLFVASIVLVAAFGAGVAPKTACATDVEGKCSDTIHFIFDGSDPDVARIVTVKNTGSCTLVVFARKKGESIGETFTVAPGAAAARGGKFVHFNVKCSKHGTDPCKATVTGFG